MFNEKLELQNIKRDIYSTFIKMKDKTSYNNIIDYLSDEYHLNKIYIDKAIKEFENGYKRINR